MEQENDSTEEDIDGEEFEEDDPLIEIADKQLALLKKIEGQLNGIRSMLVFFTVLIILGLLVQACSVLGLI